MMQKNPDTPAHTSAFDQTHASKYDQQWIKLAPMRDSLHFLIRMAFSALPEKAHILCVGVGTGNELITLAQAFPQWRFTAVEPSGPMLQVCIKKAEEAGIASRCQFHEGYLDSLSESAPFDAATSLLVSQFLTQPDQRREFFRQISRRLKPGGLLVNADLSSDLSSPAYKSLGEIWTKTLMFTGITRQEAEQARSAWGELVAVLPAREIEAFMIAGGFEEPLLISQNLFIHAWCARNPS